MRSRFWNLLHDVLLVLCISLSVTGLQVQTTTWTIAVDAPLGTIVGAVDANSTAKVTCALTGNSKALEYFTINPNTCVVTIKKSLLGDIDNITLYNITVQATENGVSSPGSSVLLVPVNRDLYTPDITNLPATVNVNETTGPGTVIFKGLPQDKDSNSQVVCDIPASYVSIFFQINASTCQISIRNSLRFDTQTSYQIPVQVYDIFWPITKVTRTLTVIVNRNVNSPVFSGPSTASVNNSFSPGDTVLALTATDADGDHLTFTKVNAYDNSSSNFIVDSSTGNIILVKPLPGQALYSFDVQVSDNRASLSQNSTVKVTVNVTNVQFPPYWLNAPYNATININAFVSSEVPVSIRAAKTNLLGNLKYRISGGVPEDAKNTFNINENSGKLTLSRNLGNFRSSAVVFIEAFDDAVPTEVIYSTVTMYFVRNLSPPVFTLPTYSAAINDYDPPGTNVITIGAIDTDSLSPENITVYKLDTTTNGSDYFDVNMYTGLISVAKRVSQDTGKPNTYTLYIIAQDPSLDPRSSTATVTISVYRNVAPLLDRDQYIAQISDTQEVMMPFLHVLATDSNSLLWKVKFHNFSQRPLYFYNTSIQVNIKFGKSIAFSKNYRVGEFLNRPDSDNGKMEFSINNINNRTDIRTLFGIDNIGQIYPVRSLRYLTTSVYTFQVVVSDRGVPSLTDTANVTVTVTSTPGVIFSPTSSTYTLPENNTTPAYLETAAAINSAGNSALLYENVADGFAKLAFSVNAISGDITQILPFSSDPVRSLSYVITVRAYRQNDPTIQAFKTVRINVNRNPTPPVFGLPSYTFTVPENQALGSVIGKVNATDSDFGSAGDITYSISKTSNSPLTSYVFFHVDQYSGEVSISRSLLEDHLTSTYKFPVLVTDNGVPQLTSTSTCTVNVLRNMNGPVFVPNTYSVYIKEDAPVGLQILDLNTTEADNQPVSYRIVQNDINILYFKISNVTGIISIAGSLLQSTSSVFPITVFASDDQPSPRTDVAYVTVYVIRNPNPPVFSQALWLVRISEYQQVNVPLLTLAASDKDPPNSDSGKITFSVINQTAISPTSANAYKTDYFTVGSNNGQIYLARALTTLESADEYDIYIKAQDGAVTPRSDVARVNIKIVRNMYRPVFEGTNFTTTISETQDINTYILNATAVDNDTLVDLNKGTSNAEVMYELRDFLVSDRQSRYFGVTETGMIYKKQATTGDSGSETFSFQVLARDNNWKRDMLSVCNVSITVNYVGSANGQLGFLQPIFLLEIQENVGISDAHPVLFMDVENQENNEVVCSISGGSDTFTVRAVDGQKNCALFLTSPLDVVRRDRYDLTVEVESKALTETGRRRRQTSLKYNSWGTARVVIDVNDVNNNAPQWVYVPYPRDTFDAPDGTRGIFITAVDYSSPPDTVAMQFKATDLDLGLNGEVRYSLDVPTTSPPPFQIDVLNGNLITKDFPSLDRTSRTLPYQLTVKAYDLSIEPLGFKSTTAECFVNLIRDENRFVLVIKKSYTEVVTQKETYRQALQNSSSLVILLERIEPKRYIFNGALTIDLKATDVTFVAALPKTTYQLLTYNDPQADSLLTSMGAVSKIRSAVGSSLSSNIEAIRQSYGSNVIIKPMLIKSYIWWMDDPWAALIALASIIMLLSVVGIVVISFSYASKPPISWRALHGFKLKTSTWTRFWTLEGYLKNGCNILLKIYRNYVLKYRHQMEKSVVLDKQDNYEVQSLHMYVPQDDSAPPYDDLNMNSNSSEVGKISNNKYISTIDTQSWPPALRTNLQHDKLTIF